jgi:hypothetical protein
MSLLSECRQPEQDGQAHPQLDRRPPALRHPVHAPLQPGPLGPRQQPEHRDRGQDHRRRAGRCAARVRRVHHQRQRDHASGVGDGDLRQQLEHAWAAQPE